MTRHERQVAARVVPQYEIDTLGAPFKVTVSNCVTLKIDPSTGKELVTVPDLVGLINAVVRSRVTHPRKLTGVEIKFIRNALGVKANAIAEFLEMTPEHLSRCEAGAKVMSGMSEKHFRLFAYLATFCTEPEDLLAKVLEGRAIREELAKKAKKPDEALQKFAEQFLMMKIESAFDAGEELHFDFSREIVPEEPDHPEHPEHEPDAEWEPRLVCCGGVR